MEQKFNNNRLDLQVLREFCEREGEFVCDYPTFLYGRPSQATIEAMVPSRVLRQYGCTLLLNLRKIGTKYVLLKPINIV